MKYLSCLSPHPDAGRVVKRIEVDFRRCVLHGDNEFIVAIPEEIVSEALGATDIAVADIPADRIAVTAAGQIADRLSVAQDGFAPDEHDIRIVDGETGEGLPARRALGGFQRPATE